MEHTTFDSALTALRRALNDLLNGTAGPVRALWSQSDDVTIANPFGPPRRGQVDVTEAIDAAAGQYQSGVREFVELARFSTDDLGYVVQIEQTTARAAGTGRQLSFALRTTTILRREHAAWKVVHRHADPLSGERSLETFADPVR